MTLDGTIAAEALAYFTGVTAPEIHIGSSRKLIIPEKFSVKIGGSSKVLALLASPSNFKSCDIRLQGCILDILYGILAKSYHNIFRFQFYDLNTIQEEYIQKSGSFVPLVQILCQLLPEVMSTDVNFSTSRRLIRLIGLTAVGGITVKDLKFVLAQLRCCPYLTTSWLQALKLMMQQSNNVRKGAEEGRQVNIGPATCFNFGGPDSGMFSVLRPFPFQKEYQFFCWFRLEGVVETMSSEINQLRMRSVSAPPLSLPGSTAAQGLSTADAMLLDIKKRQTIISMSSTESTVEICVENRVLTVHVLDNRGQNVTTVNLTDYPTGGDGLKYGVWYHVAVRHCRPNSYNIFGSDEFSIHINHQPVYQGSVRFPATGATSLTEFSIGRNFDGQIGPVTICAESFPVPIVQYIAEAECNCGDHGPSDIRFPDLQTSLFIPTERKSIPISSKIISCYHPTRIAYGHVLDIHGGRHARLGAKVFSMSTTIVQDVLQSLGGLSILLPLLPNLLLESEAGSEQGLTLRFDQLDSHRTSTARPLSLSDLAADTIQEGILSVATLSTLDTRHLDIEMDSSIGLLLSILSLCVENNSVFIKEMISVGAINMIEYILLQTPQDTFVPEWETSCMLGLIQLREACQSSEYLEKKITKQLLFNFVIWSRASIELQGNLVSILLADVKMRADYFISLVGVQKLLDAISVHYLDSDRMLKVASSGSFSVDSEEVEAQGLPLDSFSDDLAEEGSPPRHSLADKFGSSNTPEPLAIFVDGGTSRGAGIARRRSSRFKDSLSSVIRRSKSQSSKLLMPIVEEASEEGQALPSPSVTTPRKLSTASLGTFVDGQREVQADEDRVSTPTTLCSAQSLDDPPTLTSSLTAMDKSVTSRVLTKSQRKHIRGSIRAMIMTMIQTSTAGISELKCLLTYTMFTKDAVVQEEIAQMVLCLIVEGGEKVLISITETFCGPEEFASLVLSKFVRSPVESIRCIGIRLLTHYYLRVDKLPLDVVSMTLKGQKSNILARTIGKIAAITDEKQEMQRLQACGGINLLLEYMTEYIEMSSARTYAALLEMLLTKPGSSSQVHVESKSIMQPEPDRDATAASSRRTGVHFENSHMSDRTVVFAAHYLSPELVNDEESDMTNAVVLPLFCLLIPKLPSSLQEQVIGDLLALLKHSTGNRESFCSTPAWHVCMFSLVSQFVEASRYILSRRIVSTSQLSSIILRTAGEFAPVLQEFFGIPGTSVLTEIQNSSANTSQIKSETTDSVPDLWFSIGMKVYSTLLQQVMERPTGWWEVLTTISQAWALDVLCEKQSLERLNSGVDYQECVSGRSVSQAILSHLVSDMAFNMRKTYSDLKLRIKSKSSKKSKEATARLENILSILTTSIDYALDALPVSTLNVPCLRHGKLRAEIVNRICDEASLMTGTGGTSRGPVQQSSLNLESLAVAEERLVLRLAQECATVDSTDSSAVPISVTKFDADLLFNWATLPYPDESGGGGEEGAKKRISRSAAFNGDSIHPLDRDMSLEDGSLILVLQTLRLFDSIFWPSDDADIRNGSLLKVRRLPASMVTGGGLKGDAHLKHMGMTLFATILRSSIFVLSTLSPLNDLATLNCLRLTCLLRAASNPVDIPRQIAPVNDWVLAAVVHVTLALQRVVLSLGPLFRGLSLCEPDLAVLSAGKPSPEEEAALVDVQIQDTIAFDAIVADEIKLSNINAYFETVPGRNLLRFIKSCLGILVFVTLEDWIRDILHIAIDTRDCEALFQFVDRIVRSRPFVGGRRASEDFQNRRNSEEFLDLKSVGSDPSGRKRANSVDSDLSDSSEGASTVSDNSNANSPAPKSPAAAAAAPSSPDPSVTTSPAPGPDSARGAGSSRAGEHIPALSAVTVVQLIRDPFLRTANLCRSVTVVRSLLALENGERACASSFFNDMEVARKSLSVHSSPAHKFTEEAKALKDLSINVLAMITSKEKVRISSQRIHDESHAKRSASCWSGCLSLAESSWSPWYDDSDAEYLQGDGVAKCELVRIADARMYRMISTTPFEPKDHSGESYFDTRQRDQQLHLDSLRGPEGGSGGAYSAAQASPPNPRGTGKMAWLRDAANKDESWEVDDDSSVDTDSDTKSETSEQGREFILNRGAEFMGIDLPLFVQGSVDQKRPHWTLSLSWQADEKVVIHILDAILIRLEVRVRGDVLLSNKCVYFHPKEVVGGHGSPSDVDFSDARWNLDQLNEMLGRRYLQKNCALELFFIGRPGALFAFPTPKLMKKFWSSIRNYFPPSSQSITQYISSTLTPHQVISNSPWTDLWRRRLISNFEYLMRLNAIAGRSYNDISQYPVFPWIIADYVSSSLDLSKESTYRDLSKPMGAMDPHRLQYFIDRYNSFDTDSPLGPPFLYGSHYSTEGYIVYYMIRQEPFTTLGINLQEGRFDCPDRLFFDLRRTWDGCSQLSVSDVKELIPEFFCCPEMLVNSNGFPLGELQEGGVVGDVVLPPWAKDAFEFVRLNREALESEYVSSHLNEWIDLIFGFKQVGPAAVEAHNVFHYLTYENAVDLDKVESEDQRRALQAQVTHYGQTPSQLFKKPHVKRLPREECVLPLFSDSSIAGLSNLRLFTPKIMPATASPIISIRASADRLVTCQANLSIAHYKWSAQTDSDGNPFVLRPQPEKTKPLPTSSLMRADDLLAASSFVPLTPSYLRPYNSAATTLHHSPTRRQTQIYNTQFSDADLHDRFLHEAHKIPIVESTVSDSHQSSANIAVATASESATASPDTAATSHVVSSVEDYQSPPHSKHPRPNSMPTTSRRPLFMLYGAIKKGITDMSEYSGSPPPATSSLSPSAASVGGSFFSSGSASASEPSPSSMDRARSLSTSPRPAHALDEHLFGEDSPLTSRTAHQLFNRFAASALPKLTHQCAALSVVDKEGSSRVVTTGYWDNSLRVHALDSLREVCTAGSSHVGLITCLHMVMQGGHILVTGGADCTVRVWVLENPSLVIACTGERPAKTAADVDPLTCVHILRGHQSSVSCVHHCPDLDLVVSGDADGEICLHTARQGRFIRTISSLKGSQIDSVLISSAGYLVAMSGASTKLDVFYINGQPLASLTCSKQVSCLALNGSTLVLVQGGGDGVLTFRSLWDLEVLNIIDNSEHGSISSLWFTEDLQFLLVGSQDGSFSVVTEPTAGRKRIDGSTAMSINHRVEFTA